MTLERRTPLKRAGRVNPISDRRRRFNDELEKIRPEILARGCEFEAHRNHGIACRGQLLVHHKAGRWRKDSNAAHNLMCVCRLAHETIHAHPAWARRMGYLI